MNLIGTKGFIIHGSLVPWAKNSWIGSIGVDYLYLVNRSRLFVFDPIVNNSWIRSIGVNYLYLNLILVIDYLDRFHGNRLF